MSILPYQAAISKWDMHKNQAIRMSERLCAAGAAAGRKDIWLRGDIMKDCSQRIEYTYCPDCGSMHLRRTNLCRDRLCPLCAWRLSLQRIGDMLQVIDYMTQQRGAQLSAAMLTLTVKNCQAKELGATIGQMLKAWDRLIKRRKVAKWVSGYARSIEVTRAKNGVKFVAKLIDNRSIVWYNAPCVWQLLRREQHGGIAQLARAFGSYPKCPRFESRCRYQTLAQRQ